MKGEKRVRLSMVSYQNTIPFIKGLERTDDFEVIKDIPSKCLDYFINDEVDIALVPVGALVDVDPDEYEVITDYCIGCNGAVRTVCLFSNEPVKELTHVKLDAHSRTSVKLAQVLLTHYWNVYPDYEHRYDGSNQLKAHEGIVLIGDKVFDVEGKYKYKYDLGQAWKEFTGLPFVFAVWIARKSLSQKVINQLNEQLKYGIDHIDDIQYASGSMGQVEFQEYFSRYIDYRFDDDKRKAMQLFLHKVG